jgi:UDP-2,4-diacetamido-2,4,6-trideoxy-beta-L-altropyranose hydrolase
MSGNGRALEGKLLLVRADVSTRIGTGHVMRCLALAQAWQDQGGAVRFALAGPVNPLEARLADEGMSVSRISADPGSNDDARATIGLASNENASWVVVDGYHFGARYQRLLRDAGHRLLVLDDYGHSEHYAADAVLNQNLGADESLYENREAHTRLLLGPRHALLRREFREWRQWRRQVPPSARNVLVTLGGADPDNVTGKVIEALRSLENAGLQSTVVVGASNPHLPALEAAVRGCEDVIRLCRGVTDMPSLLAWADMAIGAGGSSSWERAFLGLPSLIIVLADNQVDLARNCAAAGLGWDIGWHHALKPARITEAIMELAGQADIRAAMASQGHDLVDGRGSERVVAFLTSTVEGAHAYPVFRQ